MHSEMSVQAHTVPGEIALVVIILNQYILRASIDHDDAGKQFQKSKALFCKAVR